ncbi:hypothetical protein [Sulfuricurvum sp. RIFCSPLOWO2_12_FULL_43_24]|uniref:hypothetical protein n=1 Tax=Sulfuricurvum sp. RIFCSPLOWO2_12_FULL_43_24 TaxID=1802247 RepID=UPI0008B9DDA4|nr:hypothetical protein [Sulfuricurvum sp. RIFCSPLOWO2_12_FULL_43_24]OHD90601.1 MAG: hypothetical protein A3G19_11900 [Sulfuricurvum sp. RIFCSPLOWO2_12_FULL_43_24]
MKKFTLASLLLLGFGFSSQAYAGHLMFGDKESITHIADTSITTPDGKHLYLGQLIARHSFLLPYSVEDKGLVLGVTGESTMYMPLPKGEGLSALQSSGLLPAELPKTKLSFIDYLFGYALELFILIMLGYTFFKKQFAK